jgi:hypothetical protein
MVAGKQQVTETLNALNELVSMREGDLQAAYKAFNREVAELRRSGENVRWRGRTIRESTASYLDEWAKEIETIENPQVRAQSMKRREEAMKSYQGIEKPAQDAAAAYDPLLADLQDIQTLLNQDLTAQGIAGAKEFVAKAAQDAAALQQRLDTVIAEIDRVETEIKAKADPGM